MDICVVLGSKSDLPIAEKCRSVLEKFDVSFEIRVASAHRAPKYLEEIISNAEDSGCQVFIGMAGVAAALPGVIASMTTKPVIGVPVGGKVPLDSLLSIVQMPPGMPVATDGPCRFRIFDQQYLQPGEIFGAEETFFGFLGTSE